MSTKLEQNNRIAELQGLIFEEYERRIKPLYPRITVRVLGREMKVGRLWIPENAKDKATNKPVHEGIVVDVYTPVTRIIDYKGEKVPIHFAPQVVVGEHILFPHWAGDQKGLRDGNYRFINENEIIAVVEYERKPETGEVPVTMSGR